MNGFEARCVSRQADYAEEGDIVRVVGFLERSFGHALNVVIVTEDGAFRADWADCYRAVVKDPQAPSATLTDDEFQRLVQEFHALTEARR